ncbi:MAG: hypothetical protein IPN25_16325 [Sphingobacteriales bacterium]|nr:hypothetical protein [Sphingobacteriales bacterium]
MKTKLTNLIVFIFCCLALSYVSQAQTNFLSQEAIKNNWTMEVLEIAKQQCYAEVEDKLRTVNFTANEICDCMVANLAEKYDVEEFLTWSQKRKAMRKDVELMLLSCLTKLHGLTSEEADEILVTKSSGNWRPINSYKVFLSCANSFNCVAIADSNRTLSPNAYCICALDKIKENLTYSEYVSCDYTKYVAYKNILNNCIYETISQALPDTNRLNYTIEQPINKDPWPEGTKQGFIKWCLKSTQTEPGADALKIPEFCPCLASKIETMFPALDIGSKLVEIVQHPAYQEVVRQCASANLKN